MNEEKSRHDIAVYAGYVEDNKELMECSSGGIATAISRKIIREGGYVAGVAYSEDFYSVRYEIAHTEAELEKFKGSKYIDAEKGSIYKDVKALLDAGEKVLFFGIPCVVAALKAYLKEEYENLISCQLVCEGPTTMEVHRQYVEYLEKKFDSKMTEFTVRRKKDAWIPKYMYAKFENGKVFERNFRRTEYCYAFKVYGRESCYDCKFKGDNRKGDMTLGDFWGATPQDVFWNEKGVSSIFVHTEKAKELLLETEGIKLFESDFERATAENPMLIKSRKMRPERDKFEKLFKTEGLIKATKHSMKLKDRLLTGLKNLMPESLEKLLKVLVGKFFDKTFLKFLIVGCINTLFGTAIMFIFYNCLHLSYWLSSASNYFFGSILSYFLNKYFTFKYKEHNWGVIGRFIINISVCYLAAYGIAKPLVRRLLEGCTVSVQENIAMIVGMVLFTLLNYFGQRFFAFKKEDSNK